MIPRVGVLDDEPRMAAVLAMVLRRDGYDVVTWTDPRACLAALADEPGLDLLVTDLKMPGIDGLDVLRAAREALPGLPVVVVTAHGTVATALAAVRDGAFDFLQKPVDNDAARAVVRRALDHTRLARENRRLRELLRRDGGSGDVVAVSPAMRAALDLARRAARSDATVLLTGETGTGKEVVARAVHLASERVAGPWEAVNCKALAAGVLESELFGHERGAYTGADRARAGVFERASGGTLLLDEIGEIDADFQGKLLRAVQEGEIRRVGGDAARKVDVRLVVATHRDLRAEVAAGRFREDLYYRLSVIPIHLAPLRERREDILPLARRFLASSARELGRDGLDWSPEVEAYLLAHDWPGNVRELENTLERGAVLARGDRIELADLLVAPRPRSEAARPGAVPHGASDLLADHLDAAAAAHIRAVLADEGGARAATAARLGIERTTLYRLLKKYGVE